MALISTLFFAPPFSPSDLELVIDTTLFRMGSVDPILIAMFNLMGLWPLAYGSIMIKHGKGKTPSPYPFFIASFFTGAFAVLPYIAINKKGNRGIVLKPLEKALTGRVLSVAMGLTGISLTAFAVLFGDLGEFIELWSGSMFVYVMTADFLVLTLMFPYMMHLDCRVRKCGKGIRFLYLLPLLGPMIYLLVRPHA